MAYDTFRMDSLGYSLSQPQMAELPGSFLSLRPQRSPLPTPGLPTPNPKPKRKEKYLAIGIDFGTTYSGVSWAYSADPDVINEVSHWPCHDRRGQDEVQIPTQVDLATKRWGYLVPKNCDPIRWFKLLLLEPDDAEEDVRKSKHLQDAKTKLRKHMGYESDGIVDLVAQFLRELWNHALKEINREIEVDVLPLKVAITVPAIWPAYARDKMKHAVRRAGILASRPIGETSLILVEEPEAAALSTLFERKNYPEIDVGETFIVCDCGGGTVDIISYTVTSTDPFRVKEAVTGAGKLCGAFLVDSAFETWMMLKSGLKFDKCEANDFRLFVNDEWEYTMKRSFTSDEQQETFAIRPPARAFSMLKRAKGSSDSFPLPKAAIIQFYARTLSGIRDLISDQGERIKKAGLKRPKKTLLVGGLGASAYLHRMLHLQYENVLQPKRAWSAVARGAVIAVLKSAYDPVSLDDTTNATLLSMPTVMSRVARLSYGVEAGSLTYHVSPPVDRAKDAFYRDPDGTERVKRMKWYLKQNESVDNKEPVSYKFDQYVEGPGVRTAVLRIVTSDSETPPCRRDGSFKELCSISCEIDTPWDKLRQIEDPKGKMHRRLDDLELTMKFQGEAKWALKVGKNTVEQEVNVQYA